MAFNAGEIEATLTLDRDPFTAGLKIARKQAQDFAKNGIDVKINAKLDRSSLTNVKQQIERTSARIPVSLRLAQAELNRLRDRINRTVGRINVRLRMSPEELRNIRDRISRTVGRIEVRLHLPADEVSKIRARIAAVRPTLHVNVDLDMGAALAQITALRAAMSGLGGISGGGGGGGFAGGGGISPRMLGNILQAVALAPVIVAAGAGITAAWGAISTAIAAIPAVLFTLAAPIAAIAIGFEGIKRAVKVIQPELDTLQKKVENSLQKSFTNAFKMIKPIFPVITAGMVKIAGAVGVIANGIADFIVDAQAARLIGPLFEHIAQALINMEPGIRLLLDTVLALGGQTTAIDILTNAIVTFGTEFHNSMRELLLTGVAQTAFRNLDLTIQSLTTGFVHLVENGMRVFASAGPGVNHLLDSLTRFFDRFNWDKLGGAVGAVFDGLATALDKVPDQTIRDIEDAFVQLGDFFKDPSVQNSMAMMLDALPEMLLFLKEMSAAAFELGGYLAAAIAALTTVSSGFLDFIDQMNQGASDFATAGGWGPGSEWSTWLGQIDDNIDIALGIIPPKFGEAGRNSSGMYLTGLNGGLPAIKEAMANFWQDLLNGQAPVQKQMIQVWDQFWLDLANKNTPVKDGIVAAWNGFWDNLNIWKSDKEFSMQTGWTNFWTTFAQTAADQQYLLTAHWSAFWIYLGWKTDEAWQVINKFVADGLAWMGKLVADGAAAIGVQWRAVANFFREPINWVINVVLNNGILGAWNTVMGWISAPALVTKAISPIPAFASGGQIQGSGTGQSDSILARVSDGEYIVQQRIARKPKVGHFLNALNAGQTEALQATGAFLGGNPYPQYQGGGPVAAAQTWAGSQRGKPYIWGGVGPGGYDCSGFLSAITNYLRQQPVYRRVGTTANFPWGGFRSGLNSPFGIGAFKGSPGHMAGTLGGINVESSGGVGVRVGGGARGADNGMFTTRASLGMVGGQFVSGGAGGGASIFETISQWLQWGNSVLGLFNGINTSPPKSGPIWNGVAGGATALVAKALGALRTKLENMFFQREIAGSGSAVPGSAAIMDQVSQVFSSSGWGKNSGDQWNALYNLINRESGWNPIAKNPTSSASGLFQFLNTVWKVLGGSTARAMDASVHEQSVIGKKYITQRYGNPVAALAFQRSHNWYDEGGMLMPGTAPLNMTSQSERILSPQQTRDFEVLVGILRQLVAESGPLKGNAPYIGSLSVMTTPQASAQEIIREVTFRARAARRLGVHN